MTDLSKRISATDIACELHIVGQSAADVAHVYRSKFVEKCAAAERHILSLLRARPGIPAIQPKAPLSQKIDALRKALGGQPTSRKDRRIGLLLDELAPLSFLRSELVHSTMSFARVDGGDVILFRNAAETHPLVKQRMVMSTDELKRAYEAMSNLANRLGQQAEPARPSPSSPPPPKPA